MPKKTVYILHKNGAPSHYYGLAHLLEQNGYRVKYREFSVLSKFYKGIVKVRPKQIGKQIVNALFLFSLFFTSNKKVVLGIAPFDKKLGGLLRFLQGHQIYYHTSWTHWDKTFHPKNKDNTPKVFKIWQDFLEVYCEHVFCVTEKSKTQILGNYSVLDERTSVVNHALHPNFETRSSKGESRIPNSFVYVGRLTPEKGLAETLEFFADNPTAIFTVIGDGKQADIIKQFAQKHPNINFEGYVSNKKEIKRAFSTHQYLILNSKRTKRWEELFGLIIIEAMSQGCLPVSSAHSGPKEIIKESFGYLFAEGKIKGTLAQLVGQSKISAVMSQKAMDASKLYTVENIAQKWKAILD